MALVNVGKLASFLANGPPVDISDKFPADVPKRMLTRFADAPGVAPQLAAVSSICTHRGCPILTGSPQWNTTDQPIYNPMTKVITCPCHGSQFNVQTGALVGGPAPFPLPTFAVQVQGLDVYVDSDPAVASPDMADSLLQGGNMSTTSMTAIPGSSRKAVPNAKNLGRANLESTIRVSIFARRDPRPSPAALAKAKAIESQPISQRTYLTDDEFNNVYGASAADLSAIEKFATGAGLKVVDSSVSKRRVLVEGTVANIERAFGTELNEFERTDMGRFRGREGKIYVPDALFPIVAAVEGLDTRPVGRPRLVRTRFEPHALPKTHAGGFTNQWPGTFLPGQLASLYDFPTEYDGTGQNLAIFAFNGGDAPDPRGGYSAAALKTYFETVLKGKMPSINDIVVQGPGNKPGPDTRTSSKNGDSTGEVMLDLCVAGAIAPAAKIFVYFTEFSTQGWVEALNEAITDSNNISVISISYGNPEDDPNSLWTTSGINLVNQTFQAAASKGITVCCASGDDGSQDQGVSGAHADFPASSPWVLGVGGTSLRATLGTDPQIASEVVWNDLEMPNPSGAGGGGVSSIFPLPSYQNAAGVPPSADTPHRIGRGVPDVAAVADPYTGVVVMHVSGKTLEPIGGTSASAPLWAGLIIRINQALGAKVGFLNPTLYANLATGVLNDITVGNNGAYQAGIGWDPCTGFGSPDGNKLLHALKNAPAPPSV